MRNELRKLCSPRKRTIGWKLEFVRKYAKLIEYNKGIIVENSGDRRCGIHRLHTAKRPLERGDEVVGMDNINDYYDLPR